MSAKNISFGSFNLLNFHLPNEPIYSNTEGWSDDLYRLKTQFTANVIRRLGTDVIGLQELWSGKALDEMLELSGLDAAYKPVIPSAHDENSIVCAALVRPDILVDEPEWITEFPEECVLQSGGDDPQQSNLSVDLKTFSRPVLHLKVRVHEDTPVVHVFVCHFKSRNPTRIWKGHDWYDKDVHGAHSTALGYAISTIRRTAEAAALRVLITRITKKTEEPVVVLGDMNDGKMSNTLNILTEQPSFLSPLSLGGSDNALYTAQTMQEYRSVRDVYYTHVFKKYRESLDHILFSEQFYDNSRRRLWAFDEMTVENDHLNYDDHKTSGTTDHGIIRCSFKWKPEKTDLVA